jgi:hypothetical protein
MTPGGRRELGALAVGWQVARHHLEKARCAMGVAAPSATTRKPCGPPPARSTPVNALMTATYWEIGRRIVEHEQGGRERAEYGEALLNRLAAHLTARFGRGFGVENLHRCCLFYLACALQEIYATLSRKSGGGDERETSATPSRKSPTPGIRWTSSGKSGAANILQTPCGESANQAIIPTLSGPHYADTPEHAVGHGISVEWHLADRTCRSLRTA